MDYSIVQNLTILFCLALMMIAGWWGMIRWVNWSMGFNMRKVYEKIYSDPLASAVLRAGVMFSIAYIIVNAFGRYV